jgi:enamine deaminase RidA (YjgF/YER057c/UK114 family)
LVLTDVEIIEGDDGVGVLKINSFKAVEKEEGAAIWEVSGKPLYERVVPEDSHIPDVSNVEAISTSAPLRQIPTTVNLPRIKVLPGGLAHISELFSQNIPTIDDLLSTDNAEADLAVLEAQSIFSTLNEALKRIQWTPETQNRSGCAASAKDVVFVHLYLSNISHFAKINQFYSAFFGTVLPPSRSCVAVGTNVLAGGRRVMMDCMIQRGSGSYMRIKPEAKLDELETLSAVNEQFIKEHRQNLHHKLRSTLHVQTISHWAPICVGPYSQANTLRSGLHFMAGQIGLSPGTMTLVDGGWKKQLYQSWKNAASVLDALEGSLKDVIGGIVYVGSEVVKKNGMFQSEVWEDCEQICRSCMEANGGMSAGNVDETNASQNNELYGGYEDLETYREIMAAKNIDIDNMEIEHSTAESPLLMIAIPQMPVGAISEVELICGSNRALSCLDMKIFCTKKYREPTVDDSRDTNSHTKGVINWDTGYDGIGYLGSDSVDNIDENSPIAIESVVQCIGKGCAAAVFTTASVMHPTQSLRMHVDSVILEMIDSAVSSLEVSSGLGKFSTLHIRLFYIGTPGYDGSALRTSLNMAVGCVWNSKLHFRQKHQFPAVSIVPVEAMALSPSLSSGTTILALQLIAADLIHMETEMWIHHNRTTSDC